MIWHVATFKLENKEDTQAAAEAIWKLKDVAEGTIDYQVGINFVQDKPTAAEVCLVGKFVDRDALNAYMTHPVHTKEVAPALFNFCGKGDMQKAMSRMVSCDFETEN